MATYSAKDSFQNSLAKLGDGMENFLSYTSYPIRRFTRDYALMNSLYRNSWICRRVVDCVAVDAQKNWVQFQSKSLDVVETMERAVRKTSIRPALLQCHKWGRLFGGAAGLMVIKGDGHRLHEPLGKVKKGSFCGIIPLDRWCGIYPQPELVADPSDPDFGLPAYYYIQLLPTAGSVSIEGINPYDFDGKSTIRVHHSRIIRFIGDELPIYERTTESYWGASCLEQVFEELKKRDNTSYNIAQLVFLANLRVLKKEGMGSAMEVTSEHAKRKMASTLKAQADAMSNTGMYVIGEEDEFKNFQYNFSGLSEVYRDFMLDVAGAADIPDTRLYGRSLGSNDMGYSTMNNYNDRILQVQNTDLHPKYARVFKVMAESEGIDPDSFDFKFMPSATLSQKDIADMTWRTYESIIATYSRGLVSRNTALRELKRAGQSLGIYKDMDIEQELTGFKEYMSQETQIGAYNASFENRMGNTKSTVGKNTAGESNEPGGKEEDKIYSNRERV